MCLIEKIFRLCKVIKQKILERKNLQHYLKLLLFTTANIFKAQNNKIFGFIPNN